MRRELDSLTGGKPWLTLDFSRALGTFGLGGLTTQSSNPAPPASDAFDLTPLLVKTLKDYKPGTCGPSA
ncbi:MAG TPA: hypothetical protein VLC49_00760 [Solirubrobacteraceae bacterium]|nr:hypothetical protein [Solirubrobacteraceae bacterium]